MVTSWVLAGVCVCTPRPLAPVRRKQPTPCWSRTYQAWPMWLGQRKAMWAADRIEGIHRQGTPQAETNSSVFLSVTLFPRVPGKAVCFLCVLAAVVTNRQKSKVPSMWVFCKAVLAGPGRNDARWAFCEAMAAGIVVTMDLGLPLPP